jgi:hypothetical protein
MSEWGNPPLSHLYSSPVLWDWVAIRWFSTRYLLPEYIGFKRRTRRTETSQYPKERKSNETPVVVASETGPGRTLKKLEAIGKGAIEGDSPV